MSASACLREPPYAVAAGAVGAAKREEAAWAGPAPGAAALARFQAAEGQGLFRADWLRVAMIHYAISPDMLRPHVPFELDLRAGRAWVSLVAFTQERLRPVRGGALLEALSWPLAKHVFLNLRTYVHVRGEPGIFFLAEWIPNLLAAWLGPRLYGLPYRRARMSYTCTKEAGAFQGTVRAAAGSARLKVRWPAASGFSCQPRGALGEFLMERYSAFTWRNGQARVFRIWHVPWPQSEARAEVHDAGLLSGLGTWWARAELVGTHFSPGVNAVLIGAPRNIGSSVT